MTDKDTLVSDEGYALSITPDGIRIATRSNAGLFYGIQTLKMMLLNLNGAPLRCCRISDFPDLKLRGALLHLRHMPGKELPWLKQWIAAMSELKMNAVMLDLADNFPISGNPFSKRKFTLTREEIAELVTFAKERHIQIIPHFQCWTHATWILTHPAADTLAEKIKGWDTTYCPSNPELVELTGKVIRESIQLLQAKYFNLCIDELEWGKTQECAKCKATGMDGLFRKHLPELEKAVRDAGAEPWYYHDTFYPGRSLRGERMLSIMKPYTGIMFWDYSKKNQS